MGLGAGDTIAGYRLTHMLGEGGMGRVWAAAKGADEDTYALKVLSDAPDGDEARARMLREARAAQSVAHPHVVKVHEVLELDDGAPVIVMERLEGESLADRIARDKPLSVEAVADILLPVASAVGEAHAQGVVHRDLKPGNIFVTPAGVRVLDFGIAKRITTDTEDTAITASGAMLGTPCYMAPEQAFGERDIDDRADVWALGIIAYEALTGLLPTKADNVGQVLKIVLTRKIWPLADAAPDVPEPVASLVDRMLSRERDARPTMAEVFGALRTYSDVDAPAVAASRVRRSSFDDVSETTQSMPEREEQAPFKWWRLAAVAGVGAIAWMWWQAPRQDRATSPPTNVLEPRASAPVASAKSVVQSETSAISPPHPSPSASARDAASARAATSSEPVRARPSAPPHTTASASTADFDPLRQRR